MGYGPETELYAPVKAFLEGQGYVVKAEVASADVMACRGDEEPVIIELKVGFSLSLLHQAVKRQSVTDAVYVAVPRWRGKSAWRAFKANIGLCKKLGLGVMSVSVEEQRVEVHADPTEFSPRKLKRRKYALLREYQARQGDPNVGGTRGKVVTSYRQAAERIVRFLAENGASRGVDVATGADAPKATRLMANNHYGWFVRVERGVYDLSEAGHKTAKDMSLTTQ